MSRSVKKQLANAELLFFGTVKGLVKERAELRVKFDDFEPEVVLLGIAPEELKGLKKYLKEPFEIEPDDYEVIYAKKLERYGEVGIPVPTYLEVFSILKEKELEIVPIDMPDKEYTSLFVKKIDFFKIMRHDMRKRKIWKMRFDDSTPEDFVMHWDREINRIKAFREIEQEREKYMASKISEFVSKNEYRKIIVVLELERMDGVLNRLNAQ